MKAIGDLGGGRRPVACALGIGTRPVACNDCDARMLAEPLGQGGGGTPWQQGDRLLAFEINEHRAIRLAFAEGKIIHAQVALSPGRREGGNVFIVS